MWKPLLLAVAAVTHLVSLTLAAAAQPTKLAVFEFALVDSSLEGELAGDDEERARLHVLDRELLEKLGEVETLAPMPLGQPVDLGCRACEVRTAKDAGADYALAGWVQKVSDLILNINLRVTATGTGQVVFLESVDIRGNSDQSWLRGLRHLVDRHLLAPPR